MKLKVVQVNIFKGMYLEALVAFLESEAPDFISMQEVTCGAVSNYNEKSVNLFKYIRKALGLDGVFYNDVRIVNHPDVFHGNAVFSKYDILESKQVVLRHGRPLAVPEFNDPAFFPEFPRSIIDASCDVQGRLIHVLSVHGAWTAPPMDTPETLRQAREIAEYLQGLNTPFIMGGDMNTTPDKEVIKIISTAANNLMADSGILRTTHPKVHKVAYKELLVDYIFASKEFKRISVKAPEVLISDHLPVIAELEI